MKRFYVYIGLVFITVMLTACGRDKMTAEGENKKGLGYYESGDYQTAREYFERALSIESSNKEVLNNYGMALIQLKENDLALEQFGKVIDGNSSKKLMKFAYRGQGIAYMQKLDFQNALDSFVNALEIDSESGWDIDILYYKANAQECLGQVDEAIATYTAVLEEDKDNLLTLRSRGNLYREKKEYEKALADYRAILDAESDDYHAYIGMYRVYCDMNETDKASTTLEKASHLKIRDNEDKYLLGQVHFYQKNYTSAKIEMTNAVENGFSEAYFFLGEIAMAEEEYEQAIEYYEKYRVGIVTVSPTVCNQEAVCYLALFNYDKAEEMINLGLSFGSSSARQQLMRNRIAMLEGRYDLMGAYNAFQEYIVEFPSDSEAIQEYKFVKKRLGFE